MSISQPLLWAFSAFALVMFFTPGPNNIMLLSSGLTYGFRRTLPHIAGVVIGFAFMVGAVGVGFGTVFIAFPVLQTMLKYAGAAYLIYLAAMIAMPGPPKAGEEGERGPITFWGAAVFQWVNVKGWVVPAAGRALDGHLDAVWQRAAAGAQVRTGGVRFQVLMALLLLASLYPVLRDA